MSEKRPSLSKMPGQRFDPAARERRKELEALDLPEDELVKALIPEKVDLEGEVRTAESYAVSSFVIEKFWDYLRTRITSEALTLPENPKGNTVSQRFAYALSDSLDVYRDQFIDDFRNSLTGKQDEEISKADALTFRYFQMKKEELGHIGFPSMKDLVSLIGRMGDVVPQVYERDLGRVPTEEELVASLGHPSLKRLFMEMMTNSRSAVQVTLNRLEDGFSNLDDYTGTFNPKYFEVRESNGQPHVALRPEVVEWIRSMWVKGAEALAERGMAFPRALQCPVLFTGKFIEMHDWVVGEFKKFNQLEKSGGLGATE
ncbi:MAG TPA: hypothetical protein VGB97_04605 [Candidatus Paceibacterota bacterium]|jgi:hypothetical protein